MGVNERGEFIRDDDSKPEKKSAEQVEWENRQQLKQKVRTQLENEESLDGIPQDIIDEVKLESKAAAERRKQLREKLSNKSDT